MVFLCVFLVISQRICGQYLCFIQLDGQSAFKSEHHKFLQKENPAFRRKIPPPSPHLERVARPRSSKDASGTAVLYARFLGVSA